VFPSQTWCIDQLTVNVNSKEPYNLIIVGLNLNLRYLRLLKSLSIKYVDWAGQLKFSSPWSFRFQHLWPWGCLVWVNKLQVDISKSDKGHLSLKGGCFYVYELYYSEVSLSCRGRWLSSRETSSYYIDDFAKYNISILLFSISISMFRWPRPFCYHFDKILLGSSIFHSLDMVFPPFV